MYDSIIIGAGVIGCATARMLSQYHLNIAVLEKEEDVCDGTSKANSGLVHAGFDAKPGTLKAKMNLLGNDMMESLCQNLDVPFRRTGAFVAATNEEEKKILQHLLDQGIENQVKGLEILDGSKAHELEPNLSDEVCAVLSAPSAGLVCPFTLTIALAENAAVNGAEFFFEQSVVQITAKNDGNSKYYSVKTKDPMGKEYFYDTKTIVNCAGVYSDEIHNMISEKKYHITARRGQYCLLDKSTGSLVSRTIFKVPGKLGKGILVTPTVHGNILLGPTAEDIDDKEGINTTREGLEKVLTLTGATVQNIPTRQVITSFSGLRAHEEGGDFILEEAKDCPGLIEAIGIESPGLSSAPAIGQYLSELVTAILKPEKKEDFVAYRKGIIPFLSLPEKEQKKLLKVRPEYGSIVCRCEMVTEGEILDAIYRPVGAKTLDGIKRRTRAGMGRCQSGFCSPKVVEILAKALGKKPEEITKSGTGTYILEGKNKNL